MFDKYARVLSRIPRWVLVPRIHQQYVDGHSYFVALYTAELIEEFGKHWPAELKYSALLAALVHDMPEVRTGDFPGPVKREIVDHTRAKRLDARVLFDMGYESMMNANIDGKVAAFIKVADILDEIFYLESERALGNKGLDAVYQQTEERLLAATRAAGLPDDLHVEATCEAADTADYQVFPYKALT